MWEVLFTIYFVFALLSFISSFICLPKHVVYVFDIIILSVVIALVWPLFVVGFITYGIFKVVKKGRDHV